jgi:hypothetical protein
VTRWIITLLGALVASWSLAAHAQELMSQTPAATPNVPQIKSVRLKTVDPVASTYQFRLGDDEVDLLKAFSLDGSDGIGSAWKVPSVGKFQERFGRW